MESVKILEKLSRNIKSYAQHNMDTNNYVTKTRNFSIFHKYKGVILTYIWAVGEHNNSNLGSNLGCPSYNHDYTPETQIKTAKSLQ